MPSNSDRAIPLAPGLLFSIYGHDLGPGNGCQGQADPQRRETPNRLRPDQMFVNTLVYPTELCGVQVLVGGIAAGLLYVQEKQINFKVPQEIGVTGAASVVVTYRGVSSAPATLPLGLESVTLSLEEPAKIGFPVWLKVSMPQFSGTVDYPYSIWPAHFNCDAVEVRRDGKLLPRIASLETQNFEGMIAMTGNLCGFLGLTSERLHPGRLPLHLQYRFDQPGAYEVRFIRRRDWGSTSTPVFESAWTPIEILPSAPGERDAWLAEMQSRAPASAAALLEDYLPSILGIPDKRSLAIVCGYLYNSERIVREFAVHGLTYWPSEEARAAVLDVVRAKGPTDVTVRFLSRAPQSRAAVNQMVEAALPWLESESPVAIDGALAAITSIAFAEKSNIDPVVRARAESALIASADHITRIAQPQTLNQYAATLGPAHDARATDVLRMMIDRNIGREQAAIALSWRKSSADLPKLTQLMLAPAADPLSRDLASLPYALHNNYGDAALPYLETVLRESGFAWVRVNAAEELIIAGRASGFRFAADAIENSRLYRNQIIQFARDRFPELRGADTSAVLALLSSRAHAR